MHSDAAKAADIPAESAGQALGTVPGALQKSPGRGRVFSRSQNLLSVTVPFRNLNTLKEEFREQGFAPDSLLDADSGIKEAEACLESARPLITVAPQELRASGGFERSRSPVPEVFRKPEPGATIRITVLKQEAGMPGISKTVKSGAIPAAPGNNGGTE